MKIKNILTRPIVLLALALLALAVLHGFLVKPLIVGFLYDDGIYLMVAKALAQGKGYVLEGLSGSPTFYKYPPLFSAILAPLWILFPEFPENLIGFKAFNITLALSALGLLFYYITRCRQCSTPIGLGLVLLLGTNLWFIGSAVELMSEPLFLLLSTALLIRAHRLERDDLKPSKGEWIFLLFLAVATLYTRSLGVILIFSLGCWLFLQARFKTVSISLKTALTFSGVCGLSLLPWVLWSAGQPASAYSIQDFWVRTFQENYFQVMAMDLTYEFGILEMYTKGVSALFEKLTLTFFPILHRFPNLDSLFLLIPGLLMIGFLLYQSIRSLRQKKFSLMGIYLSLYLWVLPVWSFHDQYPRFLMVILPFLWIELIQRLSPYLSHKPNHKRLGAMALSLCFILSLGSNLYLLQGILPSSQGAKAKITLSPKDNPLWIPPHWEDYQWMFREIKARTAPEDILWTDRIRENFIFSLYTGRPTLDHFFFYTQPIDMNEAQRRPEILHKLFDQKSHVMYQYLRRNNVQYLITNGTTEKPNPFNPTFLLLQHYPQAFKKVVSSPTGQLHLYKIEHPSI